MTVREGRSKDPVVRLETFFAKRTVAPGGAHVGDRIVGRITTASAPDFPPIHAALAAGRLADAAVDSNRTDTRFETPDSSIVTP